MLKVSKRNYYDYRLNLARGNLKVTWKILYEIINKKRSKTKNPSSFIYNDKEINDPVKIANKFCEFFTNIGPNLAGKIPNTHLSYHTFLQNGISKSLFLKPVRVNEIRQIASKFKSGKASGLDNVYINDIKSN